MTNSSESEQIGAQYEGANNTESRLSSRGRERAHQLQWRRFDALRRPVLQEGFQPPSVLKVEKWQPVKRTVRKADL